MGIAGFARKFKASKTSRGALLNTRYKAIAIDMNHLLHESIRRSRTMPAFQRNLIRLVKSTIRNMKCDSLGLFIDGPAPMAKISEQLKRRKSMLDKQSGFLSPVSLTPGTNDLSEIEMFIKTQVTQIYQGKNTKLTISDSSEHGEGELKTIKWIKDMNLSRNDKVALVGADSDLIVIGSALVDSQNVDIIKRDAVGQFSTVNIRRAVALHSVSPLDFIVLSATLGNDYIPRTAGLTFQSVFSVAKNPGIGNILHQDGSISVDNLLAFLVAHETEYPLQHQRTLEHDCESFLKGVSWTCRMYLTGVCPDFSYRYQLYAPSTTQLVTYLQSIQSKQKRIFWSASDDPPLSQDEVMLLTVPVSFSHLIPSHLRSAMHSKELCQYYPQPCETCKTLRKDVAEANRLALADKKLFKKEDDEINSPRLGKNLARSKNLEYAKHKATHDHSDPPLKEIREYLSAQMSIKLKEELNDEKPTFKFSEIPVEVY